jgi:hypothetical protein
LSTTIALCNYVINARGEHAEKAYNVNTKKIHAGEFGGGNNAFSGGSDLGQSRLGRRAVIDTKREQCLFHWTGLYRMPGLQNLLSSEGNSLRRRSQRDRPEQVHSLRDLLRGVPELRDYKNSQLN